MINKLTIFTSLMCLGFGFFIGKIQGEKQSLAKAEIDKIEALRYSKAIAKASLHQGVFLCDMYYSQKSANMMNYMNSNTYFKLNFDSTIDMLMRALVSKSLDTTKDYSDISILSESNNPVDFKKLSVEFDKILHSSN
jgi:hypothetical protein